MKIIINDIANLPLQRQIFEKIRALILSGSLVADADLPSIRAFAREHQVSVITVQKAYQLLELEGLIYSRRGKGFYVSSIETSAKALLSETKFAEDFRPLFQKARNEGLSSDEILKIIQNIIEESK